MDSMNADLCHSLQNATFDGSIGAVGETGFGVHIGVHVRDKVRKREANW